MESMSIGAKWDSYNYRLAHRPKLAPTRSLWLKISGRMGRPPPIIFARLVRPMNALQLCRWQTWQCSYKKNFVADFLQARCDFTRKSAVLRFWDPLWGTKGDLGATYDDHLRLIGKRAVDFILVLIVLFSLGVAAEELRANIGWKSVISLQPGSVDPKFQVEEVAPTNHSSSQKTRINDLSYDVKT